MQVKDSDTPVSCDKGKYCAGVGSPGYIIYLVAHIITKYWLYMKNIVRCLKNTVKSKTFDIYMPQMDSLFCCTGEEQAWKECVPNNVIHWSYMSSSLKYKIFEL